MTCMNDSHWLINDNEPESGLPCAYRLRPASMRSLSPVHQLRCVSLGYGCLQRGPSNTPLHPLLLIAQANTHSISPSSKSTRIHSLPPSRFPKAYDSTSTSFIPLAQSGSSLESYTIRGGSVSVVLSTIRRRWMLATLERTRTDLGELSRERWI